MEKLFIQAKVEKIDKDIEKAIKKMGIVYPHPTLSFFKARYALADSQTPNGNNVLLEKSVQEDVPLLVGTQVNRNHEGDQRLGFIPHAFMVGDEIQIIICFDKTYNQEEYDEAMKLFEKGKLHVSFELRVEKKNIKVEGKIKRLSHVEFCGVGLLFDLVPAFKDGDVIAKAMQIIENALNQEDKQLIFANVEDISKKWLKLGELINKTINDRNISNEQNGGNNLMDEKAKKALLDKFKAEITAELGDAVSTWSDEQFEAELVKRATEQENAEKQNTKTTTTRVYDVTEDTEAGTMEVVETIVEERVVDGKCVKDEKVVRNTLYTFAKLEAEVAKVKAEYEAKIKEKDIVIASKDDKELKDQLSAKDTILASKETIIADKDKVIAEKDNEIKSLKEKAEFYKENAKKIAEIRAELGDYVKNLVDDQLFNEDKIKIARLEKQIAENTTPAPKVTPTKLVAKVEGENLADKDGVYTKLAAKQAVEKRK